MSNIIPSYDSNNTQLTQVSNIAFFGTNSSATSIAGDWVNTTMTNGITYPFYIKIVFDLNKNSTVTGGTLLGTSGFTKTAGNTIISVTSSTVTHPWGSFSPTVNLNNIFKHTIEIMTENSSTYKVYLDDTLQTSGTMSTLFMNGSWWIGAKGNNMQRGIYTFGGHIYDVVINVNNTLYHYVPYKKTVSSNTYGFFYEVYSHQTFGPYMAALNVGFSTFGSETNTYIPGFFQGRMGLGRLSLAQTKSSVSIPLTAAYRSQYTYLDANAATVRNAIGHHGNPELAFNSYTIIRDGSTDVTNIYNYPIFNSDGSLSIKAKTSGAFVTGTCTLNMSTVSWTNYSADDFTQTGIDGDYFMPTEVPSIDIHKSVFTDIVFFGFDSSSAIGAYEAEVRFINTTTLWLYVYMDLDAYDSEDWNYTDGEFWIGPGETCKLRVASMNDLYILEAEATIQVEVTGAANNALYTNTSWSLYRG